MIAILNYKMGNLRSVQKACKRIGEQTIITDNPAEIRAADKLILPGVGHFKKGMENLQKSGLLAVLNEEVLENKKPVLGICLGMQLLTEYSEEGDAEGLGWIEGKTQRFPGDMGLKVPHIGWNTLQTTTKSPLFLQIPATATFYFVHTYYVTSTKKEEVLGKTDYGVEIVSSVHKENIYGTQFHPEKSHDYGLQLLKNFCKI